MDTYNAKDLTVLQSLEPIRRRPRTYVGDTTAQGLHRLVLNVAKAALDPECVNGCTQLQVTVQADTLLVLADDGRGLPVAPTSPKDAVPLLETVVTRLFGGRPNQHIYERMGFLFGWGAVLNALSERLVIETNVEGQHYVLTCARGSITEPLRCAGPTQERGTVIQFVPDPAIWEAPRFDVILLRDGLQRLAVSYPTARILLQGEEVAPMG